MDRTGRGRVSTANAEPIMSSSPPTNGMSSLIGHLVKVLLVWLAVFLLQQACFIFFDPAWTSGITGEAIGKSFMRALPMDLSAACYLTLPAALLAVARLFTDKRWPNAAIKAYLAIAMVLAAFINVCDIALFRSWGTKVNHKALSYLAYPDEAFASVAGAGPSQLIVVMLAQCAVALFLFSRIDHQRSFRTRSLWQSIAAPLLVPGLLLVGMRGGVQDYPIDRSWSYHSAHPVLNLGALNGVWNTIVLIAEPPDFEKNPYAFMPTDEAEAIVERLSAQGTGERTTILTTERPNVMIVLLESWTADVVGVLGGDSGVTPGFDRLAHEGMLFTNFFSTGFRTEQGLCALISAFPSQPKTTIIRQYGKFDRLPSLVNVLDSSGYTSTYYYAGDVSFANTRSYLEAMGFGVVHDVGSFPIRKRTAWGAFDEELFAFHLKDAREAREPFFHMVMTSTSHEPFDAPVDEGFPGGSDPQRYRNSVHYTDRTLAAFIDSCAKQPWYDRTLVIIVADHGHYLPRYRGNFTQERHRIPFLVTGGALRPEMRGARNGTYGSHVDLAATLLGQSGIEAQRFPWSKDLFHSGSPHFAFWTFDDGFGIAEEDQCLVYDNLSGLLLQQRDTTARPEANAELLKKGKALEQILLERYITLSQ